MAYCTEEIRLAKQISHKLQGELLVELTWEQILQHAYNLMADRKHKDFAVAKLLRACAKHDFCRIEFVKEL